MRALQAGGRAGSWLQRLAPPCSAGLAGVKAVCSPGTAAATAPLPRTPIAACAGVRPSSSTAAQLQHGDHAGIPPTQSPVQSSRRAAWTALATARCAPANAVPASGPQTPGPAVHAPATFTARATSSASASASGRLAGAPGHPLHTPAGACWLGVRGYAAAAGGHQEVAGQREGTSADMSEHDYHRLADLTLGELWHKLEAYVEDRNLPDADVEYSQGVLTVRLGEERGTYVLNKQAPNRQLWLSSPLTGPFRYDYVDGLWKYRRDGHMLNDKLETEIGKLCGAPIDLQPEPEEESSTVGYGPDPT